MTNIVTPQLKQMNSAFQLFAANANQVKSCLRCKYSAVKHISIDKAWNKQQMYRDSLNAHNISKFDLH